MLAIDLYGGFGLSLEKIKRAKTFPLIVRPYRVIYKNRWAWGRRNLKKVLSLLKKFLKRFLSILT